MSHAVEQAPCTDNPAIGYARLPRTVVRITCKGIAVYALAWAVLATVPFWPGFDREDMVVLMLIAAACSIVMLAILLFFYYTRLSHLYSDSSVSLRPLERAMMAHDRAMPLLIGLSKKLWAWDKLSEQFRAHNVPHHRTVVEHGLHKRLGPIDRPDYFLEPEPILPSSHGNALGMFALVFYVLFALVQMSVGNWLIAAVFISVGAAFAIATPAIRDRIRIFRVSDGKIIAGQGWIKDRNDRVWTTADSTMVITTYNGVPPMTIIFTGPAGVVTLSAANEGDPDFIKLWQRWNHPDPRPELAERST